MPRRPAAVLFDLDGTLVDTEGLWWEAECATVAHFGGEWTQADQQHCLGGPMGRVADYMRDRIGTEATSDQIATDLLDRMEALLRTRTLEWRPGARDLLRAVRAEGTPTGLVSASYRRLMDAVDEAILADLGERPFDTTVAGDEVDAGKPDPEPYLRAASDLAVDIRDCIVIEDSPTGVASGQASGAWVVAVPHIVEIPPAPRRTVVTTLTGITVADLADWLA